MDKVFVSVIIPTYNRSELIGITLDSLMNQSYPRDRYEILVVDNNSNDKTAEVVKNWEVISEGLVLYHFEPRQGSHFARNGIVKQAKGDILYFTDDDMIADENMLEKLISVFSKYPEVATATGRVYANWGKEPPGWVLKYCNNGWLSLYDHEDDFFISDDDFGVFSCHQAVRKDVFIKAGGYNPDIVNGEWLGDNETGLNIKIRSLGYKFAFVRESQTQHMIPPARMTQKYLNKRFANQGNCDSYTNFRKYRYSKKDLKLLNRENYWKYTQKLVKFVFTRIQNNDKWHIHRAYLEYYKSRMAYNKKLMTDSKWVEMVLMNDWINN